MKLKWVEINQKEVKHKSIGMIEMKRDEVHRHQKEKQIRVRRIA